MARNTERSTRLPLLIANIVDRRIGSGFASSKKMSTDATETPFGGGTGQLPRHR